MASKLFLLGLVSLFCLQAFAAVQGTLYNLIDNRYLSLLERVKMVQYSDQKASILQKAVNTYGFNCTQTWGLLSSFKSDGDKLIVLEMIKNNIVDPINKTNLIIEMFNRTDDKQRATTILANITAAKTISNPNDQVPIYNLPFANKWSDQNLTDLIKVMDQIPSAIGKIKVAEVAIMSRSEVLVLDQVVTLFNALPSYKDILTLKASIDERIVGISCEQMITLLKRFSFENQRDRILDILKCGASNVACSFNNDLIALGSFIQENLVGKTCEDLSPIAETFAFEDQMLALLEGFTTSILDIENKMTILDAFSMGASKEKARKILNAFRPNSYIFGSPSGKVYFILDTSSNMQGLFRLTPIQTMARLIFMRNEFKTAISGFNESMGFGVFCFNTYVNRWNNGFTNATEANKQSAISFVNRYGPDGPGNAYEAIRLAMEVPGLETVYYVSGGIPNGYTPSAVLDSIKKWNPQGKIKINTIALMLTSSTSVDINQVKDYMKSVADITGGTYRAFDLALY